MEFEVRLSVFYVSGAVSAAGARLRMHMDVYVSFIGVWLLWGWVGVSAGERSRNTSHARGIAS